MLIKFIAPDPRAGTVVLMDSSRGQYFIDTRAAVKVSENGEDDQAAGQAAAPPLSAKPSEGLKVDELKAALLAKGIAVPEGAKKPGLAALLDGAD